MDKAQIAQELREEIDRLTTALNALTGSGSPAIARKAHSAGSTTRSGNLRKGHQWTAAEKKAMSARLKQVWKARKTK
jgi:hypothetical protein